MTFQSSNKLPTATECEIINSIRVLYQFYGKPDENRIKAYASQLVGCSLSAIKAACSHAINEMRLFPSLADLKGLVAVFEPKKNDEEAQNAMLFEKETKRVEILKEQFDKIIGLQHLERYVRSWFIGVYGKDAFEEIKDSNFAFHLWEKPALFDLADAQMNPKKANEVGIRKQIKITNNINKGRL